MRLEPVRVKKGDHIQEILPFFMGKNTPERQDFIIDNLRMEEDLVEEAANEKHIQYNNLNSPMDPEDLSIKDEQPGRRHP